MKVSLFIKGKSELAIWREYVYLVVIDLFLEYCLYGESGEFLSSNFILTIMVLN